MGLNGVSVPVKKASKRSLEHVFHEINGEKPAMCEIGSEPSPDTEYAVPSWPPCGVKSISVIYMPQVLPYYSYVDLSA